VGEPVDKETLLGLLARRRPGQSPLTTGRNEKDEPEFLSGARDGMLTGEPERVEKSAGMKVSAGTLNGNGTLTVRADMVGADTELARIVRSVRDAQGSKAPVQRLGLPG
jgi:hypothetical protein